MTVSFHVKATEQKNIVVEDSDETSTHSIIVYLSSQLLAQSLESDHNVDLSGYNR